MRSFLSIFVSSKRQMFQENIKCFKKTKRVVNKYFQKKTYGESLLQQALLKFEMILRRLDYKAIIWRWASRLSELRTAYNES